MENKDELVDVGELNKQMKIWEKTRDDATKRIEDFEDGLFLNKEILALAQAKIKELDK